MYIADHDTNVRRKCTLTFTSHNTHKTPSKPTPFPPTVIILLMETPLAVHSLLTSRSLGYTDASYIFVLISDVIHLADLKPVWDRLISASSAVDGLNATAAGSLVILGALPAGGNASAIAEADRLGQKVDNA